jgi:hypothetical protein
MIGAPVSSVATRATVLRPLRNTVGTQMPESAPEYEWTPVNSRRGKPYQPPKESSPA